MGMEPAVSLALRTPDQAIREPQRAFEALPDEDSLAEQLRIDRAELLGEFWPYPPDGPAWAFRGRMSARDSGALPFLAFRPLFTRMIRGQLKPFDEAIDVARQPWPGKLDATDVLAQRYEVHSVRRPARQSWLERAFAVWPAAIGAGTLSGYLPVAGMNLAMRHVYAAVAIERFRRARGRGPGHTVRPGA